MSNSFSIEGKTEKLKKKGKNEMRITIKLQFSINRSADQSSLFWRRYLYHLDIFSSKRHIWVIAHHKGNALCRKKKKFRLLLSCFNYII